MALNEQQDVEDCTASSFGSIEEVMESHSGTSVAPNAAHLIFPENRVQFDVLCESFREAEERVKQIEWRAGLDIPSINELRYVGFHLIKAVQSNDATEQDEQLRRAFRHCRRAEYDAVELGILSCLGYIQEFQENYRDLPVIDHVEDYQEMLGMCEKIKSRQENSIESEYRDEYYKEIYEDYMTLIKYTEILKGIAPELDKKAYDRWTNGLYLKISLGVAVFAAIAGWVQALMP